MKILVILGLLAYVNGDCGTTPVKPTIDRIVGGTVATPYSWPWQVEFCQSGWFACSLMCGGSIIAPNWVVTAGHCVYGSTNSPGNFKIKAGVFDETQNSETGEQVVAIEQIILHPQYNSQTTSHDIALLKLKTPLTFSNHIQPVCLAQNDDLLTAGTLVTVTGWGTTSSGGSISKQLRQVQVPVLPQATCDSEYKGEIQDDVMFCAGMGGKDSCQGDSGGPLVLQHSSGNWFLHGIVSWGQGCALPAYAGVYSRVSAYCDFIQQNTGVSCMA